MKSKKQSSSGKTNWEYFDDCSICKTMEESDKREFSLSKKELKVAFKKQNGKNNEKEENVG